MNDHASSVMIRGGRGGGGEPSLVPPSTHLQFGVLSDNLERFFSLCCCSAAGYVGEETNLK